MNQSFRAQFPEAFTGNEIVVICCHLRPLHVTMKRCQCQHHTGQKKGPWRSLHEGSAAQDRICGSYRHPAAIGPWTFVFDLNSALKGGQRSKFKYKNVSEMSVLLDYCTQKFEDDCKKILGNVSKKGNADGNTYWKFICNFEDLSAYAFRKELIVQSFSITGLAPFSLKMIRIVLLL
jgi:hypothetical protein